MQLDATIANGIGYVQVDTSKKYQTIEGFGGAFTEASAKTWMRLPVHERKRVIDLYFGENGAGYTLGRVHMNSCDFCVASYDFAPVDNDYELKHFDTSVKHDQAEMIPLMRAAKKLLTSEVKSLSYLPRRGHRRPGSRLRTPSRPCGRR